MKRTNYYLSLPTFLVHKKVSAVKNDDAISLLRGNNPGNNPSRQHFNELIKECLHLDLLVKTANSL
jgi:hypothetical protein